MKPRHQIGFFGVLALVLLRVATGWHFFDQGLDKFDPNFSSEGFLRAAKGPLAEEYHKYTRGVHSVDTLLFVPKEWDAEGNAKPYEAWQSQIVSDWESYRDAAGKLAGDADEALDESFNEWSGKLDAYLATQAEAMAEYQNELWRLEQLKANAPSGTLPFNDERTSKKASETFSESRKWVAGVRSLEAMYRKDLVAIAEAAGAKRRRVAAAVEPPTKLDKVDTIVKWTVVSVGVCLMVGFCTRLAAFVGAAFLCSVIATQPPWVYGAHTDYFWYQLVEVAGMLVLMVFGAGRWLGFDAMWKHLWRR